MDIDVTGAFILPAGKYKGKAIQTLNEDECSVVLRSSAIPKFLKTSIKTFIKAQRKSHHASLLEQKSHTVPEPCRILTNKEQVCPP